MAIARMVQGQTVQVDGRNFQLHRQITDYEWQLECLSTAQLITMPTALFWRQYGEGKITFVNNRSLISKSEKGKEIQVAALDQLPSHVAEQAKIRLQYVNAVNKACCKQTPDELNPIIVQVWEKLKQPEQCPNWTTVYRWCRRHSEAGQDIRALVAQEHKKGNRHRRYDKFMLDLVAQAVNTVYLKRERNTMKDTLSHAIVLVKRENALRPASIQLPLPTLCLVKAEIESIPAYERDKCRFGPEYARRKYRAAISEIDVDRPLERVEIDHTTMDIMVVDDKSWLPLGRPTLTMCTDVMTKCVLGIYIGFLPPSYASVAHCLKHAILPKDDLRKQYPSIGNQWEPFGVMETLVVDNGMEFHSIHLESLCYSLGIEILYTPRKTPWFKPGIERAIGTMGRNVAHGKPGTTFENIFEKDDYDPIKKAVISLSKLKEIVTTWIVGIYHQTPHRTLERPPLNVWRENIDPALQFVPVSKEELEALLGGTDERELDHKGLQWRGLTYNSRDMAELRRKLGGKLKVSIRYNPEDIGYIHVLHPDSNEPIKVPAKKFEYANGLSLWLHEIIKRYAKKNMSRDNIEALAEAKERIRQIVEEAMNDRRVSTRKKAARAAESLDNVKIKTTQTSKPSTLQQAETACITQGKNEDLQNTTMLGGYASRVLEEAIGNVQTPSRRRLKVHRDS